MSNTTSMTAGTIPTKFYYGVNSPLKGAWHGEHTGTLTVEEMADYTLALSNHGNDYPIITEPLLHPQTGKPLPVYGIFAEGQFFGTCKEGYVPTSHREVMEVLSGDGILLDSYALYNGFMACNFLTGESVVAGEKFATYLQAINGFNGSIGISFFASSTRMVCGNTCAHAMRSGIANGSFTKTKHTKNVGGRLFELSTLLNEARNYTNNVMESLRFLATRKMTPEMAENAVKSVYGVSDIKELREGSRAWEVLKLFDNNYLDAEKSRVGNTAYGLFNAATGEESQSTATMRVRKGMSGTASSLAAKKSEKFLVSVARGNSTSEAMRQYLLETLK